MGQSTAINASVSEEGVDVPAERVAIGAINPIAEPSQQVGSLPPALCASPPLLPPWLRRSEALELVGPCGWILMIGLHRTAPENVRAKALMVPNAAVMKFAACCIESLATQNSIGLRPKAL